MSKKNETGGAAFPTPPDPSTGRVEGHPSPGMELRDWFAGQALSGLLADSQSQGTHSEFARDSYVVADAMIAAREAE